MSGLYQVEVGVDTEEGRLKFHEVMLESEGKHKTACDNGALNACYAALYFLSDRDSRQ
jgi:hypothetical protein